MACMHTYWTCPTYLLIKYHQRISKGNFRMKKILLPNAHSRSVNSLSSAEYKNRGLQSASRCTGSHWLHMALPSCRFCHAMAHILLWTYQTMDAKVDQNDSFYQNVVYQFGLRDFAYKKTKF